MEHKSEETTIEDQKKRQDGVPVTAEIEKSIRKKFQKQIFSRFAKDVRDYQLYRKETGLPFVFPAVRIPC